MILECSINTDLKINNLMDLTKLKPLIENGLKVNKSRLARELEVDRRTVSKYIDGYNKPVNRNRRSAIDDYYDDIVELLNDENRVFEYKRDLWQYLCDNRGLKCADSTFRHYISIRKEFQDYFDSVNTGAVKKPSATRYETDPGEQAQLDWKESVPFILKTGEMIVINILVLMMGYSRFRVYNLSLSKTQDILFHFIDRSFEIIGGIPKQLLTDNMKTVMDEPRTEYSKGKINPKFEAFARDYGFEVKPCIAGRPNTKAKVESPMKILDELKAYSGELSYDELVSKLQEINDRENTRFHKSYSMIPILGLNKEKDFLLPLPTESIRNHYQIKTVNVKVNHSSMITYKGNQYSVPPEYIGKQLKLQYHDNRLHLYCNTELVAIHEESSKKLNYLEKHYIDIMKLTLPFTDDKITERARENLKKIGERYSSEHSIRTVGVESGVPQDERDDRSS